MARHGPHTLTIGRGTQTLAGVAVAVTVATVLLEWARVWRHESAAAPDQPRDLLAGGRAAGRDTLAVIREGYRATPNRENALFNMLAAFAVTFGGARAITALIRSGRVEGLLGNVSIGDRHIHHFVPGFILGFTAGGIAIATRRDGVERWLAVRSGPAPRWSSTKPRCCWRWRTSTGPSGACSACSSRSQRSRCWRPWRLAFGSCAAARS